MKESMNLKELKNSNILVAIYVDDLKNLTTIEETFYSISKQTKKVDLLVLFPKTFSEEQIASLKSVLDNPKIILRKKNEQGDSEEEILSAEEKINYILSATDSNNFPKIFNDTFNISVENKYEYISIIEPNDIVGLNWYNKAAKYSAENENISIFFPMIRNTVNGVSSGILNEAPWAEGLSEEAGKIDLNLLNRFNCMIPVGSLIKTSSIKEYSELKSDGKFYPIKESMKISHYYEFLLRMVYNDVKGMCIPRIGYEFRTTGFGESFNQAYCKVPQNISQIPTEKGGISPAEGKFWMDTAKKEYFFDEDRNKVYAEAI